jgi:hypothetical protein
MADFDFSQPVRSNNENQDSGDMLVTQINGGLTPANKAEVNDANELLVNDAQLAGDIKVINGDTAFDVATVTDVTTVATVTEVTTLGTITNDVKVINGDSALEVAQTSGDVWEVHMSDSAAGDQIHKYDTAVSGAIGTPVDVVTHTVAVGKVFLIKAVSGACSGKGKIQLFVGADCKATGFVAATSGVVEFVFPSPIEVAAGVVIKVTITNKDNATQDLYAFINGIEIDA